VFPQAKSIILDCPNWRRIARAPSLSLSLRSESFSRSSSCVQSRERFLLFLEIFLQLVEIFRLVGLVDLLDLVDFHHRHPVLGTLFWFPAALQCVAIWPVFWHLKHVLSLEIRIIGVFLLLLPTLLSEGASGWYGAWLIELLVYLSKKCKTACLVLVLISPRGILVH
jgi:hypothetical protein